MKAMFFGYAAVFTLTLTLSPVMCAQLSIQIDSIEMTGISWFESNEPEVLSGKILLSEGFASYLAYGPHITVSGKLINSSSDAVVYEVYSGEILTDPIIRTSFEYKGRTYVTRQTVGSMGDLFRAVDENHSWKHLSIVKLGSEKLGFLFIPGNSSVPIEFGGHFLYGSKLCKLKLPEYAPENKSYNIKHNRKLEKIAREVQPTIKASIEVETDWGKWSKLIERNMEPLK